MLTFAAKRCLRTLNNARVLSHAFSWSSDSNKRSTSPKPVKQTLPDLKGADSEYPGQWNENGESKNDTNQTNNEQSYLENEYFGGKKSPIQEIHGLIKPKLPDLDKKETLTPLAQEIKQIIHARGPMTFSTFWQMCMQHPQYGYYMTSDPIGREGDFITTPEMFSGFSECLAVWCAFTWESMGRPNKIKIIEYGPGLGSVAKTIIDVLRKSPLKPFKDSISIHLIESSKRLRWKQKTKMNLGHIRKFKTKVQKPVYAVTDANQFSNNGKRSEHSAHTAVRVNDYAGEISSKEKGQTPLTSESEIKMDPKKRLRAINTSTTPPPTNPFKADQMFGGMSNKAMSAMDDSGEMRLTDEMKQKYKPFDWSQHNEGIFGHIDEDMKPYVSGEKTREWEQKQSKITVHSDPLSKTDQPSPVQKTEPKKQENIKIYNDEAMGEIHMPKRKTKRDMEKEVSEQKQIYSNEKSESDTENSNSNPFQSILNKMEISDNLNSMNFSDLSDFEDLKAETTHEYEEIWQTRTKDNILISWHDSLHSIDGECALFICHEFFDALPVSHFEFRPHGWVETVVDVDDSEESTEHFKLIRGPCATFASTVLDRQFQSKNIKPSIGQQFSICSQGNEIASHISKWIAQHGGAGIIIDYGDSNIPAWTVQGIKDHKPANILSKPGEIDMSSHVNFNALTSAIQSVNGMKVFGPVTQSYFLQGCGIIQRFRQYMKDKFENENNENSESNRQEKEDFFNTFAKIMDIEKLGGHFKVLGFGKESMGVPIGFRTPISQTQAKTDEIGLPIYK